MRVVKGMWERLCYCMFVNCVQTKTRGTWQIWYRRQVLVVSITRQYQQSSTRRRKLLITKLQFMVQAKDVTHNITLCENKRLVSAEEWHEREREPAAPWLHIHTHTRLILVAQAPHWGLIDGAHSYWTTDVRGSQGNYKQPLLWDRSLKEAWGRGSRIRSGNLLFIVRSIFNNS